VVLLAAAGPEISRRVMESRKRDYSDQHRIAEELGKLQSKSSQIILLDPHRVGNHDGRVLPQSFYLFYGTLQFPITSYLIPEMRQFSPKQPAIGVCALEQFPLIQQKYLNAIPLLGILGPNARPTN
jgi:hypothetical protein